MEIATIDARYIRATECSFMSWIEVLYQENEDFRLYVSRFCKTYGLTIPVALQHALVREAAKYYREKETEDEQKQ